LRGSRDERLTRKDIEGFKRRALAFPPEVVRGAWATQLTTPPGELTVISEALLPASKRPCCASTDRRHPMTTRLVPTVEVEVWEGMGHLLYDLPRFAERVRLLLS
jgi:hypothetical protein